MGGSISIDKIDGWVKATTMGGDVKVVMTGDPSQGKRDVEISSMGGDIRLTVPAGLSMDVDITLAYTKDALRQYRIISDFDLELEETDKFDYSKGSARKYIYGTGLIRGGKYKIVGSTVNGNVYLKEGK